MTTAGVVAEITPKRTAPAGMDDVAVEVILLFDGVISGRKDVSASKVARAAVQRLKLPAFEVRHNAGPGALCWADTQRVEGIRRDGVRRRRDMDAARHDGNSAFAECSRDLHRPGQRVHRDGNPHDIRPVVELHRADVLIFDHHMVLLPQDTHHRQKAQRRRHAGFQIGIHGALGHLWLYQLHVHTLSSISHHTSLLSFCDMYNITPNLSFVNIHCMIFDFLAHQAEI